MALRNAAAAAALACAVGAAGSGGPVRAQTATPAPDRGFVGKGTLAIQSAIAGVPMSVGGNIAFESRNATFRVDIVSLTLPGATPSITAGLATSMFPPGGFSVVFDKASNTYTVWSTARHAYFTGDAHVGTPAPSSSPNPTTTKASSIDPLSAFKAFRGLKDDRTLSLSLALTGHGALFGHPTTMLHYAFVRAPMTGSDATDVHGDIALAEDLDEFPIELTASAAVKGIPPSALRLDLTQLARQLPPANDFVPPAGFTRAASIADVIGVNLTH